MYVGPESYVEQPKDIIYSEAYIYPRIYIVWDSSKSRSENPWEEVIRQEAQKEGVDPNLMVRIARCESGFKSGIHNANSTASGLFQYLDSTWNSMSQKYGITTFKDDPYGQIKLTAKILKDGGISHWNASRSCWQ